MGKGNCVILGVMFYIIILLLYNKIIIYISFNGKIIIYIWYNNIQYLYIN